MSALGLQEDQLLELLLHLKVTILHYPNLREQ